MNRQKIVVKAMIGGAIGAATDIVVSTAIGFPPVWLGALIGIAIGAAASLWYGRKQTPDIPTQ